MNNKVTCHECGERVSMSTTKTIDGKQVELCGVCDCSAEPCRGCESHDVIREVEPGCFLCAACLKASTPEQKRASYEREYAELLETGNPVVDHLPLPSGWRG